MAAPIAVYILSAQMLACAVVVAAFDLLFTFQWRLGRLAVLLSACGAMVAAVATSQLAILVASVMLSGLSLALNSYSAAIWLDSQDDDLTQPLLLPQTSHSQAV